MNLQVGGNGPGGGGGGAGLRDCLICFKFGFYKTNSGRYPTSAEEDSCLGGNLWVIFTLRKVLGFPKEGCEELLRRTGGGRRRNHNPGGWITLCSECSRLVKNAAVVNNQIMELEKDLEVLKNVIRGRLEKSLEVDGSGGGIIKKKRGGGGKKTDDGGIGIDVDVHRVIREHFKNIIISPHCDVSEVKDEVLVCKIEVEEQADDDEHSDDNDKSWSINGRISGLDSGSSSEADEDDDEDESADASDNEHPHHPHFEMAKVHKTDDDIYEGEGVSSTRKVTVVSSTISSKEDLRAKLQKELNTRRTERRMRNYAALRNARKKGSSNTTRQQLKKPNQRQDIIVDTDTIGKDSDNVRLSNNAVVSGASGNRNDQQTSCDVVNKRKSSEARRPANYAKQKSSSVSPESSSFKPRAKRAPPGQNGTFECRLCGNLFKFNYKLQGHIRRMHLKNLPGGPPPTIYKCNKCPCTYESVHGLRDHVRHKHSANPPTYKCDICGLAYPAYNSLKHHRKRASCQPPSAIPSNNSTAHDDDDEL